ncbi:hypothetical protein BJX99DRAFT_258930 [Aspergillus californicus]
MPANGGDMAPPIENANPQRLNEPVSRTNDPPTGTVSDTHACRTPSPLRTRPLHARHSHSLGSINIVRTSHTPLSPAPNNARASTIPSRPNGPVSELLALADHVRAETIHAQDVLADSDLLPNDHGSLQKAITDVDWALTDVAVFANRRDAGSRISDIRSGLGGSMREATRRREKHSRLLDSHELLQRLLARLHGPPRVSEKATVGNNEAERSPVTIPTFLLTPAKTIERTRSRSLSDDIPRPPPFSPQRSAPGLVHSSRATSDPPLVKPRPPLPRTLMYGIPPDPDQVIPVMVPPDLWLSTTDKLWIRLRSQDTQNPTATSDGNMTIAESTDEHRPAQTNGIPRDQNQPMSSENPYTPDEVKTAPDIHPEFLDLLAWRRTQGGGGQPDLPFPAYTVELMIDCMMYLLP